MEEYGDLTGSSSNKVFAASQTPKAEMVAEGDSPTAKRDVINLRA